MHFNAKQQENDNEKAEVFVNPFIEGILKALGQKAVEAAASGLSRSDTGPIASTPPGELEKLCMRGLEAYESKPYIAVQYFQVAAERGHAPSQAILGICLREGHGCRKNEVESKKWLQLAAQAGDDLAIQILAHQRLFDDAYQTIDESNRSLKKTKEFLSKSTDEQLNEILGDNWEDQLKVT